MRKFDYIEKPTIEKVKDVAYLYCDKCGKLIYKKTLSTNNYNNPVQWFKVTTGHHDWGNDSVDSIETKELCCECIKSEFEQYHNYATKTNGEGNIMNSEYIEIEHNWCYSDDLDSVL